MDEKQVNHCQKLMMVEEIEQQIGCLAQNQCHLLFRILLFLHHLIYRSFNKGILGVLSFQQQLLSPDGAATMFHIINAIFHGNSAACPLDDFLILLTLDIKNAFNTHSRQRIYDFFQKKCPTTEPNEQTWSG
jgi:hypothetical protein